MTNRLGASTSPYLLQHKDNPVDWWEWGEDAFAEAHRRDVPVLLSVGYAACHWCHVMAHESFESQDVADVLNEHFVAVKVDREERPDIDAIYMSATTAMTGHGGWPMTCLLTPNGDPFFAGTYFPREQFLRLLDAAIAAWHERRDEVTAAGSRIVSALRNVTERSTPATLEADQLSAAAATLAEQFDAQHAGFGTAPKFPPSMVLEFLLRHHARTGDQTALAMVATTCDAMARGGMYDQLGGGFARYSVDARWIVPHFEKMLYDNAQLLRGYLHLYRASGDALAVRVVRETADFLLRDLRTQNAGFASSLDADTDGAEGLTYAWAPHQLAEVLGTDDGGRAAEFFQVTEIGTFEHGSSTLQRPTEPDDENWFSDIRDRLFQARMQRPQPARDDKVIAGWNGLAIAALAEAGALLPEQRYIDAAEACAAFLLDAHLVEGRLRRASRDGQPGAAQGVAEDYGNLAEGLLALHQATGSARWLAAAGGLLDTTLQHFRAPDGGFYDTADDAEQLFLRPRDQSDNAAPAGQSALAGALLSYSALTGSTLHREAAVQALEVAGQLAVSEPRFAGWTLAVAEAAVAGPLQVAVVGDGPVADTMAGIARASTSPGLVLVHGLPDAPGIPLLADRPIEQGAEAAAYVCRGFVCDRPVIDPVELRRALASAPAHPSSDVG